MEAIARSGNFRGGMMYTIQDLEDAQKELELWHEKFANDSSNNPNKHRSQIKQAASKVKVIREQLKANGLLEMTPEELLNRELDKLYPNAKSKTIVEYGGKRYQVRYYPAERSRSRKTVTEWAHSWNEVKE